MDVFSSLADFGKRGYHTARCLLGVTLSIGVIPLFIKGAIKVVDVCSSPPPTAILDALSISSQTTSLIGTISGLTALAVGSAYVAHVGIDVASHSKPHSFFASRTERIEQKIQPHIPTWDVSLSKTFQTMFLKRESETGDTMKVAVDLEAGTCDVKQWREELEGYSYSGATFVPDIVKKGFQTISFEEMAPTDQASITAAFIEARKLTGRSTKTPPNFTKPSPHPGLNL